MKALSLRQAERFVDLAKSKGVSKVARSRRGFMTAYRKAKSLKRLPLEWKKKRINFIKRHMAQVVKRRESLFDKKGMPTRRHLALIMWGATTPAAYKRLKKFSSKRGTQRRK